MLFRSARLRGWRDPFDDPLDGARARGEGCLGHLEIAGASEQEQEGKKFDHDTPKTKRGTTLVGVVPRRMLSAVWIYYKYGLDPSSQQEGIGLLFVTFPALGGSGRYAVIAARYISAQSFANEPLLGHHGRIVHLVGKVFDLDRKSTRLNSSHVSESRMPSSA